jgi:hypothetical protein
LWSQGEEELVGEEEEEEKEVVVVALEKQVFKVGEESWKRGDE